MSSDGVHPEVRPLIRRHTALASAAVRRRWRGALWWIPVVLAAVYGLVVLSRLRGITASIYTNSDFAMAPVIAHSLGGMPAGGEALIGNHRWYEQLTFLWATDWLPFHRQLWDLIPVFCALAGVAVIVVSARRVFGLWPAALSAAALVCVGEGGRTDALTFSSHAATEVHAIILGGTLMLLAARAKPAPLRWLAAGLGLGLFSALAVPDPLFLVWGLLPFAATAALIAWRETGPSSARLLGFALATVAVALIAGGAYVRLFDGLGIRASAFPLMFASGDVLTSHFVLMLEGFMGVAGGDFFGSPISFAGLATFATGAMVLVALVTVLVEVRRRVRVAGPPVRGTSATVPAGFVYVSFWSLSLVSTVASFTLSSAAGNQNGGNYLLGGYVAVAALLPLFAQRGFESRLSLAVGVSLFALVASYQLLRVPVNPQDRSPSTRDINAVARFASSHHLQYGYAGYWDSAPFTWGTDFKVQVFPVAQCSPANPSLCRFAIVHVTSWYTPRAGTPTFLIVDPTEPFVSAPDPAFGKPVLSAAIDHLRLYVYSYDIASRLRPGYAG